MTPDEFAQLLADPYFADLEHVGITGGEPTLKRNLVDYYLVLPPALPKLTGASFITHGLDTDRALAAYAAVAAEYTARGLAFHGMVSIDGVGAVHDRVRGRPHAFDQATRTLFGLKQLGVDTVACCTIVRSNVWGLWDLLEWGFDKTYIRFRVGEFINRLGNADRRDEIRAFDDAERAELISFFETLIRSYEPNESVRKTYASIVSLLAGGQRLTGCPYRDGAAINLDCRGQFALCAPKGAPHAIGASATLSVMSAETERRTIIAGHCSSCIHDYHHDWLPDVAATLARESAVLDTLMATGE
jgi:sulfatase maturation enzyme AslB (radical SAM superfamily)